MKERLKRARIYVTGEGLGPFLVRSVAGSSAVQLGGMILTFLVGVQLARGLGVAGYGYYGIAMAVVTLATIPASVGIPKLVIREIAAAQSRNDNGIVFGVLRWAERVCWRISAVIATIIAVAAAVAWTSGLGNVAIAVLLGVPMIVLLPLASIRGSALRGLNHIVLGQLPIGLVRPLAMSILLFAAFSWGLRISATSAMALNSVTVAGALVLASYWLASKLPQRRGSRWTGNTRGWIASSIPMALTDAIQNLQVQLAILVLGALLTAAEAGLFRVATTISIVVGAPMTTISLVALSPFASLHATGDYIRLQKVVTHCARLQFAVVVCLALPLLIAAGPILAIAFGQSFASAAGTLKILVIGQIINAAAGPNGAVLNMTGHERRVSRAVFVGLALNIVSVVFFSPSLGSVGGAIGVVASQICWNALLWADAKNRLSIDTSVLGLPFNRQPQANP